MAIPKNAKKVFKGINFEVYQWEQEMFDGSFKTFEKAKRNNTVDILAVCEDGMFYIMEEDQPGRKPFLGLVGGGCEKGETPLETAKRELLEETGMQSNDWKLFGEYSRSSRIEHINYLFIARNCKKVSEQSLDSGEKIKVLKVSWDELKNISVDPRFRTYDFTFELMKSLFLGKEGEFRGRLVG